MVRVAYICGCGRSGSTFLDVVLGQHAEIESLGELEKHVQDGWGRGRKCACGAPAESCPFWRAVRGEWDRLSGGDVDVVRYAALDRSFGRMRQWPRLLAEARRPSPAFREYACGTTALYEAIGSVSGKPIVVDSSKVPARAFALSLMPELDLRVIHLVRDVRGMAWSHIRRARQHWEAGRLDARPPAAWLLAAGWSAGNLQADWIRRRIGPARSVRVTYEEVVGSPATALPKIGSVLERDLSAVGDALARGLPLRTGHMAGGNRLRMAGTVRARPDLEWTEQLPRADERVIRMLAGPLMARYGYER